MHKDKIIRSPWLTNLCMIVSGTGIGWLTGLSVSPVISIVVTSAISIIVAAIAALNGLNVKIGEIETHPVSAKNINLVPLTLLIVGVVFGSTVGILARNQSWLGSDVSGEVLKWTQAGFTKLPKEEIISRLFDNRYPISNTLTTSANFDNRIGTYLFSASSQECEPLIAAIGMADDTQLKNIIKVSTIKGLPKLLTIITNTTTLKEIVKQVICAQTQQ